MNRRPLRSLALLLALTGACGGNVTTTDMASTNHDLGMSTNDLATATGDMAVVPPTLTIGTCATATVTAATIYSTIIMNNCAGAGCHRGNGATQVPMFGDSGASVITATVGKPSSATMNYITASDPDKSYLLYKVYNQHTKVPGGNGSPMPLGLNPLSAADMCKLVNWVRSGAQ